MRVIKAMEDKYLLPSLELVERVFTAHSDPQEGVWSGLWWRKSAAKGGICPGWSF